MFWDIADEGLEVDADSPNPDANGTQTLWLARELNSFLHVRNTTAHNGATSGKPGIHSYARLHKHFAQESPPKGALQRIVTNLWSVVSTMVPHWFGN